jgi:purine catabolism regulator
MAKVKAVSVAEKKLRGDLIEAVLTQAVTEADALRWAERLGFRRTGPFVALALQWGGVETPSLRRLETLVSGQVRSQRGQALASAREGEIVVFYAASSEPSTAAAAAWAQQVNAQAIAENPRAQLAIGIGRTVNRLVDLRLSYREAAQAMALEHRLHHNRPQVYSELGVYRLLLPLAETGELRAFADQVLGPLVKDERAGKSDLLDTLRAYLRCNGNVMQAARELYIHRNTLLYRLERIHELGNLDLDDAETLLKVQLALKAHELVRDGNY